jgi:hypothetical protein
VFFVFVTWSKKMLEEVQSWIDGRRDTGRDRPDAQSDWKALVERYTEAVDRRREAWEAWRAAERLAAIQAPPPEELSYGIGVHGRRLKAWLEDESSIRRSFASGAIDAARMQRLMEVLQGWARRRDVARAEHRTESLRLAAERRSDEADALREDLLAAQAPDLDAVAYKLTLLPQIIDDVWDFSDPKTLGEVLAGEIPDRETAAVAAIYFDLLRLNGRGAMVERMRRKAESAHRAKARKPS